jgi:hypothetical protein
MLDQIIADGKERRRILKKEGRRDRNEMSKEGISTKKALYKK